MKGMSRIVYLAMKSKDRKIAQASMEAGKKRKKKKRKKKKNK